MDDFDNLEVFCAETLARKPSDDEDLEILFNEYLVQENAQYRPPTRNPFGQNQNFDSDSDGATSTARSNIHSKAAGSDKCACCRHVFNSKGRVSAKELKSRAFDESFMDSAVQFNRPCNNNCRLGGKCTAGLLLSEIFSYRVELWNDIDEDPPTDRKRGERFLEFLKKATKDSNGNLVFKLNSGQSVCEGAFLRILGLLSASSNPSDAPTMWTRLKKENGEQGLSEEKIKLDNEETFSLLKGRAKAYILKICEEYSDSFATVTSTGNINHFFLFLF